MVITGGEGDLARVLAGEFQSEGWAVDSPGRSVLDVTDVGMVEAYFAKRKVDLLVCAAGITRDTPLLKLGLPDWDQVVEVNLNGAARCAKAAARSMVSRKTGHLVFISSYSALHPPAGQAAYAAAKAGLIGLTKSLARELGPAGIRVNVILPGFLDTRMTKEVAEARREQVMGEHVLGALNTPWAVARFLRTLEESMPFTSGQVFQLDSRVA